MDICNICCESFNNSTRLKVECEYCKFEACRDCCKKFILGDTRPHCMNSDCDREWTRQFMQKTFTKSFITKEYKKHRENLLLDKEKALFPATQPLVEREIQYERLDRQREKIQIEINKLHKQVYAIQAEQENYRRQPKDITKIKSEFVRACPDGNCKGFLSTQWKCGLCEKWTCSKCHEIKGKERDCEHECNPDNVATAALLSKDTKPCPTCQMGIFKIDGCNQMWCTQCHTAFDFTTGRIEKKIHNPHYYEWMRQNSENGEIPREPLDNPCENMELNNNTLTRLSRAFLKHNQNSVFDSDRKQINDYINYFYGICREMIHLREVIIPKYRINPQELNQNLRIDYMRNKICEEDFKSNIHRIDKKSSNNREIIDVLEMVITANTDIIFRTIRSVEVELTETLINNIKTEIDNLRNYANECFKDIGGVYNYKPVEFGDNFAIIGKAKRHKGYDETIGNFTRGYY